MQVLRAIAFFMPIGNSRNEVIKNAHHNKPVGRGLVQFCCRRTSHRAYNVLYR